MAFAALLAQYHLPPPRILIDRNISEGTKKQIEAMRADLYQADFSERALSKEAILEYTENKSEKVFELTSLREHDTGAFTPYADLVFEVFREGPDEVYVPYGSGRLLDNFLQLKINIINTAFAIKDGAKYLFEEHGVDVRCVRDMSILGAAPTNTNSIADKLTAPYRPFDVFSREEIEHLSNTYKGAHTQICQVDESYIQDAYEIMHRHGITAEPSGAAGLALYLQRYKDNPRLLIKKLLLSILVKDYGRRKTYDPSHQKHRSRFRGQKTHRVGRAGDARAPLDLRAI
jgi:hypothetical protein